MPVLTTKVIFEDIGKVECDSLVVGFFEDRRPLKGLAGQLDWLLCGALSHLIIENRMRGASGDVALLTSRNKIPARKIFLIGLGLVSAFSVDALNTAAKTAAARVTGAGSPSAAFEYLLPAGASDQDALQAFRRGLNEGAGDRHLDIAILAPDAACRDRLMQLVRK
jgi:hypothetical protein